MQVLCVDDHPVMLRGLEENVRSALPGAQIRSFRNASDALLYANRCGCDVLLCEIELSGENGLSLARKIRKRYPRAKIIFVTVCSEREHAEEVRRLQPCGYLTKPTDREQLARLFEWMKLSAVESG